MTIETVVLPTAYVEFAVHQGWIPKDSAVLRSRRSIVAIDQDRRDFLLSTLPAVDSFKDATQTLKRSAKRAGEILRGCSLLTPSSTVYTGILDLLSSVNRAMLSPHVGTSSPVDVAVIATVKGTAEAILDFIQSGSDEKVVSLRDNIRKVAGIMG